MQKYTCERGRNYGVNMDFKGTAVNGGLLFPSLAGLKFPPSDINFTQFSLTAQNYW